MSTFSRRLSVRILASLLVFSLVYAPVALLPQVSIQSVYAQGEGGQNGGGSGSGGNAAIDNAGIDSGGNLDSGAFGINNDGQVVDSEGRVVDLSSSGFGSFIATLFDFLVMVTPVGAIITVGNFISNVVSGTNTSFGEKAAAALGLGGSRSAVGEIGREVLGALGIDPVAISAAINNETSNLDSSISEVQLSIDGGVTVVGEGGEERVGGNVLETENLADWGSYVERENGEYVRQGGNQQVLLVASTAEVSRGEGVTLTWSSDQGSSCISQGQGFTGVREASGSLVVNDMQEDQVFLIQCIRQFETGGGGDNAQPVMEERVGLAYVEVGVRDVAPIASTTPGQPQTVPPQPVRPQTPGSSSDSAQGLSISASPSSVAQGGQTTLSWSSEGNSSCSFSGGWPGSGTEGAARSGRDASGISRVFNILETSTYRLSCVGADGVTRAVSATVNVR